MCSHQQSRPVLSLHWKCDIKWSRKNGYWCAASRTWFFMNVMRKEKEVNAARQTWLPGAPFALNDVPGSPSHLNAIRNGKKTMDRDAAVCGFEFTFCRKFLWFLSRVMWMTATEGKKLDETGLFARALRYGLSSNCGTDLSLMMRKYAIFLFGHGTRVRSTTWETMYI